LNREEAIGGIVIFLFGVVTTFFSLKMPLGTFRMAGTGLFPLCLGVLLIVLSSLFLIKLYLQKKEGKHVITVQLPSSIKQLMLFLGAMLLATLFFNRLGYPLVAFLLMVSLLKILGMKRWRTVLPLSFITAIVCYFLFVQWLKIPLPRGWIGL